MKRNIAVIGCGYWGKNLVRNFYELNSLHTICDIDENKLKSFQENYPDIAISCDYSQLLKNPEIRAVVIATPSITHYPLVLPKKPFYRIRMYLLKSLCTKLWRRRRNCFNSPRKKQNFNGRAYP